MAGFKDRFDVPTKNTADNNQMRDVVGNKTDDQDGDSIYSLVDIINDHVHTPSQVYPTLKDGVVVTGNAAAWTLGVVATIVGTVQNLDNNITSNPSGSLTRWKLTAHRLVVGNFVKLVGVEAGQLGTWEVLAVSDADHFDVDTGAYTEQTPPGDANETAQDVIPNDFDIHHISVEDLDDNTVYELVLYDDGVECGRVRFTKNANLDAIMNMPMQTLVLATESVITAKVASAAGSSVATISLFYHIY